MSGYKNFAVVGAGNLGVPIIDELLKAKSTGAVDKIVILSRPGSASKLDAFRARGATVIPIADYSSVSDVSKALTGIEVVVTALAHEVLNLQVPIAEAAKAAGVELFVLSEFGMATENVTGGPIAAKIELSKKVRALGLATTQFFTGGFADWLWSSSDLSSLDVKSGTVAVGGDGNGKMSLTSRPDIARYLSYVLTMLPPAETKNRTFRIESERASFNDIFAAYEKKHGIKLQVKYIPIEELHENVKKNAHDIESLLHIAWAAGQGTVGSPLDNDVFPNWNPKPVIHYL